MPEIIQNWLGTKLGILIDMAPEKFGRNTKDGKLLAQLLYNYGVIPAHILNNVKESRNYYECYNNLVVLKPWLRYIGVTHDDSTLQKMAGGEGSAAISVFYSVYLTLERKDRLDYISAQKEGRVAGDSCDRFKVSWVPETFISGESGDSVFKLASPIFENPEMINWHKAKCKLIREQIRWKKEKIQRAVKNRKPELGPLVSKHASSQPLDRRQIEAEETRQNITAFEKQHPQESPNLTFSELMELQNRHEMQPCFAPSMSEARNIVSNIKRRKKGDTFARDFQQKMQDILLEEQWREIIEKQDVDFESKVCQNLLKQSQYEKQMAKKLYLIRNQKKVLAENRKKIDSLKIDIYQNEFDERIQRELEMRGEYWEDEQLEKERIEELHRRLYDEKARLRREMLNIECRKICDALADISIRIAEFRELIGCQIPKSVMRDLKELFFKDLPIFDLLDHYEELCVKDSRGDSLGDCSPEEGGEGDEGEVEFYQNKAFERLKSQELDRQSVLDECDFNDYMQLVGPWMVELLFPDGSETEVRELVLGYIVHKLLAVKYPSPNAPVPVDVKPMKFTSVIHGLTDDTATNMLIDLMEACGILVVRVDDAINFVLAAYKEELSVVRDIDITFQKVTETALQQTNLKEKEKEVNRKMQLLKVEGVENSSSAELLTMDRETQTPRMIPEDDPLLSPNAEFGKQAFEALGAGDPVPDTVIASAIVSYVISKQDQYDGWVLLNYPQLYSQASELEYFLTGYRTLPVMEDAETIEETEGFTYRGPWGNSYRDAFAEYRLSKLVPKPDVFVAPNMEINKTYFGTFIKLKKNPGTPRRRSEDSAEFGPMEKFYSDVNVLSNFEYQTLNFQTVKNLGKQILRGAASETLTESSLEQKASVEIFGSVILELNEKWEPKRKNTKDLPAGGKKVSVEPKSLFDRSTEAFEEGGEEEDVVEVSEYKMEVESLPPRPGDPNWEWATGSQPEEFLVALAGLWENMEAVYIEDFRNVFFCLRVHRFNLVNYCGFIRKSMRILMRRPDEKQRVLSEFQQMFNEIDEDLRPEVDIKCELHVRVSELEQALMEIADERKRNSLKDATKVAQDGWVPDEMAYVVNTFLTALQLEADRSIDSCQVIMDYYVSLQQKLPDVKSLGKVTVPKLQVQDRKYSISSSNKTGSFLSPRNTDPRRSIKSLSEYSGKFTQEKMSKTRSWGDKKRRSSDSGLSGAAEFITDILTNLTLPEDGLTPFHTFFVDTVQLVTNEVRSTLEDCICEAKKSDKTVPSATRQTKNSKKPSETNVVASNENLLLEWLTALENELSRFVFRSQLILSRGIFDVNEFLATVLNILSSLTEEITEMYLKEINSISECCKVFRCGIEREVRIRPVLELKEDEFIVHMDDVLPSEEVIRPNAEEEQERFSFTIEQLNLLFQKLQRIAPNGEIIKRSLVYIFEDLRMLNPEVENCKCFPEVWNDIEPDDVTTIMNEVYQDLEIVQWKDFIIYALELPLPSVVEILTMRHLFRKFDPLVSELITRENYECVTLWFEKSSDEVEMEKSRQVKDLLYRMYQVNELQTNYSALLLAFCKDDDPVTGFGKALALAMGKAIKKYEESSRDSLLGETLSYGFELFDDESRESLKKPACCPTSSTEATMKCIPKEKIVRCECKAEPESSLEKITNYLENGYPGNVEESGEAGEGLFYYGSKQSSEASFIPFNILSSLLKASFPSLPQLSILLDCQHTFQETLNAIYDGFESYDNTLEVQKLLNHKFINRLLHTTNKFKFVRLKPVLLSVAKVSPTSRVACVTEKPNVSYCLRN